MLALSLILAASVSADDYVGRWNVRITDGDDTFVGGWFKVEKKDGGLAGSLVWRFGSAGPAKTTEVDGETLRLVREERPGKADVFEAHLEGAALKGQVRYPDGKVHHFEGRRAPELAPAGAPRWGSPVTLFDGKTLQGWKLRDPKAKMGWAVVNGELAVVDPKGNADLVSDKTFQDLHAGEKAGWRPALAFTPMMIEDGRRLIISNLDLRYALSNDGMSLCGTRRNPSHLILHGSD